MFCGGGMVFFGHASSVTRDEEVAANEDNTKHPHKNGSERIDHKYEGKKGKK